MQFCKHNARLLSDGFTHIHLTYFLLTAFSHDVIHSNTASTAAVFTDMLAELKHQLVCASGALNDGKAAHCGIKL